MGAGYKLDKKHTFSVTLMDDFEKIMATKADWVAPPEDEYDEEAVRTAVVAHSRRHSIELMTT